MFQIVCPDCANKNLFEKADIKPTECSFCFTAFDASIAYTEVPEEKKGELKGLKLVYQQNSGSITINGNSCILGRENTGAALLSSIRVNGNQVISRKHCSITLVDGKYLLKDEGSLNGTFYGVSKIDCSKEVQTIENNSIIFLGKEAFLAQYLYEEIKSSVTPEAEAPTKETPKPKKYRCNEGCGYESETYQDMCPKCMTSNSMVAIYEN